MPERPATLRELFAQDLGERGLIIFVCFGVEVWMSQSGEPGFAAFALFWMSALIAVIAMVHLGAARRAWFSIEKDALYARARMIPLSAIASVEIIDVTSRQRAGRLLVVVPREGAPLAIGPLDPRVADEFVVATSQLKTSRRDEGGGAPAAFFLRRGALATLSCGVLSSGVPRYPVLGLVAVMGGTLLALLLFRSEQLQLAATLRWRNARWTPRSLKRWNQLVDGRPSAPPASRP